ncbi:MAG: DUF308 domain-containing protein [Christensenellales bacterium]
MKKNNDFPLRSAAKEIKMSFTLAAVIDLILGCVMLFVPAHVTQLLCVLVGAGITIYGLFNILSFIFRAARLLTRWNCSSASARRRSARIRCSARIFCPSSCSSYSVC